MVNATFRRVSVESGGLAIGSHAVGLGLGLLGHAAARRLGVSVFVSLGNRVDVSTSDLLEWCGDDERTAAVMLYVESFGDPRRFTRVAQRVARDKPVLVVKEVLASEVTILSNSPSVAMFAADAERGRMNMPRRSASCWVIQASTRLRSDTSIATAGTQRRS